MAALNGGMNDRTRIVLSAVIALAIIIPVIYFSFSH
jgi:hypothetical protein